MQMRREDERFFDDPFLLVAGPVIGKLCGTFVVRKRRIEIAGEGVRHGAFDPSRFLALKTRCANAESYDGRPANARGWRRRRLDSLVLPLRSRRNMPSLTVGLLKLAFSPALLSR